MYRIMVEERADESSSGAYVHVERSDLGEAQRTAAAARMAYPNGAAWVEDQLGNVVPANEHACQEGENTQDEYPECPTCPDGGRVGPSAVGGEFYCYECCGKF